MKFRIEEREFDYPVVATSDDGPDKNEAKMVTVRLDTKPAGTP
jgi:hypothetical protein